jgi:hypothetical protein
MDERDRRVRAKADSREEEGSEVHGLPDEAHCRCVGRLAARNTCAEQGSWGYRTHMAGLAILVKKLRSFPAKN